MSGNQAAPAAGEPEAGAEAGGEAGAEAGAEEAVEDTTAVVPFEGEGDPPFSLAGNLQVWVEWTNGQWFVNAQNADVGQEVQASLPHVTSDGQGFWQATQIEGAWFLWQGGETEMLALGEVLNSGGSSSGPAGSSKVEAVLTGQSNQPSLLPGMRLPDEEENSLRGSPFHVVKCVCVDNSLFACMQDEEEDPEPTYPCIMFQEDGSQVIAASPDLIIPLDTTIPCELLTGPNGQVFVDAIDKNPSFKPRYLAQLERKHLASLG